MLNNGSPQTAPAGQAKYAWYRELSGYHWFVLIVASLGWLFDTMAQQLFNIARVPAMRALLGAKPGDAAMARVVSEQAGYATMIFMIGWATGGVVFGILGDRLGRAKTMIMTILLYSLSPASAFSPPASGISMSTAFSAGLGVGGQFAVGVALVAETMPDRARPYALGMVQALSAVGNMMAALTGIVLGQMEQAGTIASRMALDVPGGRRPRARWRCMVFKKLKEPESWLKARAEKKRMGSFGDLFADPRWRRNSIVGMLLAFAGVVGLWGIGFFSFDLLRPVLEKTFRAQGLAGAELAGKTTTWIGITSLLQNIGAFLGINAFTWLTHHTGRRKKAFAVSFVAAMGMTAFTFWKLKRFHATSSG